jgi:hypothetical protein
MADRNEVLANFQALSNIEDIAICLDILEAKGWDLMAAVNSVLPENNYSHSTPAVHLPPLQAYVFCPLSLPSQPLLSRHQIECAC